MGPRGFIHRAARPNMDLCILVLGSYGPPKPISYEILVYLIGPDGLVNQRFVNFEKMVWMITVHVLRFRIKHQKSSEIIRVHRHPSVCQWSEKCNNFTELLYLDP